MGRGRWISQWRGTWLLGSVLGSLTALGCKSEMTAPSLALVNVSWLEWPPSVSPDRRDSVRVLGFRYCDLALWVEVGAGTGYATEVSVIAQARVRRCPQDPIDPTYDTTIALPTLREGIEYQVVARVADVPDRIATRGFGWINLGGLGEPDTIRHVGGMARLLADSAACVWVQYSYFRDERYLVLNPPRTGPISGPAFVGGHLQATPSRCGQDRGIYLDFIELRVFP